MRLLLILASSLSIQEPSSSVPSSVSHELHSKMETKNKTRDAMYWLRVTFTSSMFKATGNQTFLACMQVYGHQVYNLTTYDMIDYFHC